MLPLLKQTYEDVLVTTSPGSGQLLVMVQNGRTSTSHPLPRDIGSSSYIILSKNPQPNGVVSETYWASILAHEMAHTWQYYHLYLGTHGDRGVHEFRGLIEGGADLFAQEWLRRQLGYPLQGNIDPLMDTGHLRTPDDVYLTKLHIGTGDITWGYSQTEPLLRDFVIRLVRAGLSIDQAFSRVSLGAAEGWVGFSPAADLLPGLTARMSGIVGSDWSPERGILSYTLDNALDERAGDSGFANYSVHDAWRHAGDSGFPPEGSLDEGTLTRRRRMGSTGYFELTIPDEPLDRVVLTRAQEEYGPADLPPNIRRAHPLIRWMVARID